jgi:hypothetical protein
LLFNKFRIAVVNNVEEAEKFKNLGNNSYKTANYREAIDFYSKAIGKYFSFLKMIDDLF